jgi:Caulimovirus viroplasmin
MLWRWAVAQVRQPATMHAFCNCDRNGNGKNVLTSRCICDHDIYQLLTPGIYRSWDDCKAQVHRFPAAIHKAFQSEGEAAAFIDKHGQNRGFAASSKQRPASAAVPPAAKRRRKKAAVAAASLAPLQEMPTESRASDAEPDAAAAESSDADDAADDAAVGAAVPTIWGSMLYRLVRLC